MSFITSHHHYRQSAKPGVSRHSHASSFYPQRRNRQATLDKQTTRRLHYPCYSVTYQSQETLKEPLARHATQGGAAVPLSNPTHIPKQTHRVQGGSTAFTDTTGAISLPVWFASIPRVKQFHHPAAAAHVLPAFPLFPLFPSLPPFLIPFPLSREVSSSPRNLEYGNTNNFSQIHNHELLPSPDHSTTSGNN